MGKKKDRSKEYHFKLVSRSMADPNRDMPDVAQHVLVPYVPSNMRKKGVQELEAPGAKLGLDESVFGLHDNLREEDREQYRKRIYGLQDEDVDEVMNEEEEEKLDADCYFPADGYDYEKHLRAVGDKPPATGAQLGSAPPGFTPGNETDDHYLYGKPTAHFTRDECAVQEALDEDEEYEEADEDFFEELLEDAVGDKDVMRPALWGGGVAPSADAEADDEFDAVLDEYDDGLLGAMDDEPEGLENGRCIDEYESVLDDFLAKPLKLKAKIANALDAHIGEGEEGEEAEEEDEDCRVGHASRTLALVEEDDGALSDSEIAKKFDKVTVSEDAFDCESVLSLRSNTSNHPGRIHRPEKDKRKPPMAAVVEEAEEKVVELPEVSTLRARDETPEERKVRKAAVKEHQRMARQLKKETKELFKAERTKASTRVNAGDLRDGVKHFPL